MPDTMIPMERFGLNLGQNTYNNLQLVSTVDAVRMGEVLRAGVASVFERPELKTPEIVVCDETTAGKIPHQVDIAAWESRLRTLELTLQVVPHSSSKQVEVPIPMLHAYGLKFLRLARMEMMDPLLVKTLEQISQRSTTEHGVCARMGYTRADLLKYIRTELVDKNVRFYGFQIAESILGGYLDVRSEDPQFVKEMKKAVEERRRLAPPQEVSRRRPWDI